MRQTPVIPAIAVLAAALLSACGSSPVSPTATPSISPSPASRSPAATPTASGRALDVLDGASLSSITVSLDDGMSSVTTGADGAFQVTVPLTQVCSVTLSGPSVVERRTELRMPRQDLSLSLIPSRFDLSAFDEMFRGDGALHRWTAAPALVVVDAVLQFGAASDSTFTALDERLTAEDLASIVTDLSWGLPRVTDGAFGAFASVTVESPSPGAPVTFFSRECAIVVGRFRGLSQATSYWGYGRSARRGDAVHAGAIMIDRDFDSSASVHVRSLRLHELGHALGYCHVTRRQSFMNPAAVLEPTEFDRDATRVAFQRPPGNRAPDRDPSRSRVTQASSALEWGTITP